MSVPRASTFNYSSGLTSDCPDEVLGRQTISINPLVQLILVIVLVVVVVVVMTLMVVVVLILMVVVVVLLILMVRFQPVT